MAAYLLLKEQEPLITGKGTKSIQALRYKTGVCRTSSLELIGEEPLLIRIDDKPYSVVMRTPGEEVFHAAGLCLGEGIADSPDDFITIGYDIRSGTECY
ncbi:MAG: formate dehydrogenase accessory sulfurtransferase FdhD [Thermodesulfobacteriota bacterium]|nr:formate dehydrogenase accessory sulfurtransferase FdhD [Thermodesulfobacteriota bacterium]